MNSLLKIIFILSLYNFINANKHHNIPHKGIANGLSCEKIRCPEERGICNIDNECVCFSGFVTHFSNFEYDNLEKKITLSQCNYIQKPQLTAFLLEFIISFGVGHFYIGNYTLGLIKFLFYFSFLFVFFALPFLTGQYKAYNLNKVSPLFQCCAAILFCCWQVIDSIVFGMNFYKDGNGVKLKSW